MVDRRRRLPPQIKRVELVRRIGGRPVVRYQLTVDVGEVGGARKRLRKRYATEKDAREALDAVRGEVAKGTYVQPSELTLEQACADWLVSRHRLKPTSAKGYEWILIPVRAELGHIAVQNLTRRNVDELVRALRAGGTKGSSGRSRRPWSARSCNYMLGALSQVLDQLVRDGALVRNVVTHVDRVPGRPKKFATYTPQQVETVLKSIAGDRNRHAWHLGLSGLRRGEIGGLRWADIDFETETLAVWRTRVAAGGKVIEQEDAKSEDSERRLPIPGPLLAELKAARKRQAAEKLALGASYADLGYVVCNAAGEPYHPDTLSKMWSAAITAAGVPHIRLQDARHTCGTIMHLYDHVPAAVISAWLGHADVAFTMRTYVHSQTDALAEAAQSLARVVTIRHNSADR
ncbi:MAG: tyrosine-type recombinase/integrase [Mycobacterium sp.]